MKRLLALSCTAALLSAFLVGCGPSTSPSSSNSEGSQDSEGFNFNDTISLVSWMNEKPDDSTPLGEMLCESLERVQTKYNCTIDFLVLPTDQVVPQFIAEAMSSSALGDLVRMRNYWAFPTLVNENYLKPLDSYVDASEKMYNQAALEAATVDGKLYGFGVGDNPVGHVIYFNKDMFERKNLPDLYELYKNKEWTWDKFAEVCALAKDDSTWGSGGFDNPQQWQPIVLSYGGGFVDYSDGQYTSLLTNPNTAAALDMINKLTYVDRTCEPNPQDVAWDYTIQQFAAGKYAMLLMGGFAAATLKPIMTDRFGVVPMPIGGSRTDYINYNQELHDWVIPSAVEDERAEQVMTIIKDFYSPYNLPDEEIPETSNPNLYDRESEEVFEAMADQSLISLHEIFTTPFWQLVVPAFNAACKGEKSPSAAIDEVNSAWETAINGPAG